MSTLKHDHFYWVKRTPHSRWEPAEYTIHGTWFILGAYEECYTNDLHAVGSIIIEPEDTP